MQASYAGSASHLATISPSAKPVCGTLRSYAYVIMWRMAERLVGRYGATRLTCLACAMWYLVEGVPETKRMVDLVEGLVRTSVVRWEMFSYICRGVVPLVCTMLSL